MDSTTKANPLRWLWNQGKRVYQRLRGERIERTVEPNTTQRDRYLNKGGYTDFVDSSSKGLLDGSVSLQRWQLDFRHQLRQAYINEYLLGRGGIGNMTQADWGRLGGMLKEQYGWMNRMAAQMANGEVSPAQAKIRMDMYFKSSREAYERAKRVSSGSPDLPAYPGDGSTQCRVNCQCSWDIQETEDEWLAYWTLGPAEHCPDCDNRSRQWAPLRFPK